MLMLTLLIGFVLGALMVVAVEALAFLIFIWHVNQRLQLQQQKTASPLYNSGEFYGNHTDPSYPQKQGLVWVLESEKVFNKGPSDQKPKKEIVEVSPVRKYAKIKDQSLILTESDGSHIKILLKDCTIASVSATDLSSRKWAKRYPIQVESKMSEIYHGSKALYIYLETSWEKESWCKALRLASFDGKEKLKMFAKLRIDFHSYLASFNIGGHTSIMTPYMSFNGEAVERTTKFDGSSSKVRQFFKKLSKKASKSGAENKANWTSTSVRDGRRISEKSRSFQDTCIGTGVLKTALAGKTPNGSAEASMASSTFSSLTRAESFEAESDEKIFGDEGTLFWNMLIRRIFFDAKNNMEIKSSMQARMQRTLSNMRIPSYMGEVTCTGIHLGNFPPYIHGMRVVPSHMNEVVALDIDIEYSGGTMLDIETRLEVCELDLQENTNTNLESNSIEEVKSDILEGFHNVGEELNFSEGKNYEIVQDIGSKPDGMKRTKSTLRRSASVSKWRTVLNSIAKQVSQVPLALTIRVASLRGTLRLHIKPPPSDQLWYGFTSMPDVDFHLESSVGDHKITSGHIALFLISRLKASIRETMVLPNCESVCIPWMLAEKDDWVPRQVAPFIRVNQEAATYNTNVGEVPDEAIRVTKDNKPEDDNHNKVKRVEYLPQATSRSSDAHASSTGSTNRSVLNENSLHELKIPLLENDETEENSERQSPGNQLSLTEDQDHRMKEDDEMPRKMGTRARMLSFRKKMGEKLEERKRHIEEKGRSMFERMRGQDKSEM